MSHTRKPYPSNTRVYEAAARWRDRCLLDDLSLFDDRLGWSQEVVETLHLDFVERPDTGTGTFVAKLHEQIGGSGTVVVQTAAEMLYVHLLIAVAKAIRPSKKRELVAEVLAIDPGTAAMPNSLGRVLEAGLVMPGQAFNNYRWKMLAHLVEFTRALKNLPVDERRPILADPLKLARFSDAIDVAGSDTQAFAIQHLLLPDDLPAIVSKSHRQQIVASFAPESVGLEEPRPIMKAMEQLMPTVLWGEHSEASPYLVPNQAKWQRADPRWAAFEEWAEVMASRVDLDAEERTYKVASAQVLQSVRDDLVAGNPDWVGKLKVAMTKDTNVVDWRTSSAFFDWVHFRNEHSQ